MIARCSVCGDQAHPGRPCTPHTRDLRHLERAPQGEPVKVREDDRDAFDSLALAMREGRAVVASCTDKRTGAYVPVICTVHFDEDADAVTLLPVARMFTGDPNDEVEGP